jgi:hypothetical protein
MRSLAQVMTQKQISDANDQAAQFPGPRPPVDDASTSNGISNSFMERR